jgi:hypothetical protein
MISARSDNIFLFHGRRGKPSGSVLQPEELLRPQFQTSNFARPNLLHGDPEIKADDLFEDLRRLDIPQRDAGGRTSLKLKSTVGHQEYVLEPSGTLIEPLSNPRNSHFCRRWTQSR